MTSRQSGYILLAVLVALTALLVFAPRASRPAPVTPSGLWRAAETDPERTGAPVERGSATSAGTAVDTPAMTRAPHPTAVTIEPATATNPDLTPPPDFTGQATWWDSFGPGLYAAIRPDLGRKGELAVVCGGARWHCLTLPIITTCACLGPGSDRLIDLSLDAFRSFAAPSAGIVHVTVTILEGDTP